MYSALQELLEEKEESFRNEDIMNIVYWILNSKKHKHKLAHPGKAEDAFATLNENNEVSVQFKEAGRWS